MAKAKLHLDEKQVSKTITLSVKANPKSNQTAKQYQEKVRNFSNAIVGLGRGNAATPGSIAALLSQDLAQEAAAGVSVINAVLKSGIAGVASGGKVIDGQSVSWAPLSKNWIRRKRKSSKNLFWKNTGKLSLGFSTIASSYGALLLKESIAEVRSKSTVYGKPFTYRITLRLPLHQRYNVLNQVLAESFIDATNYSGRSLKSETPYASKSGKEGYTDAVVGYLEGAGLTTRYRPFISKVMAERGKNFQDTILSRINALDVSVNRRRGLKFGLKT